MNIKHMVDAAGNLAMAIACTIDPAERKELTRISLALIRLLNHRGVFLGEASVKEPKAVEETGKE